MPYRSYVYQKALNILERRRSHAESDLQRRTEEAMQKIPELAEIQQELARTGLSVSTLLFRGENTKGEIEKLKEKSLALQKRKKELLLKAGLDEDALTIRYVCPVCSDTGFVQNRMCACHRELLKEIERDSIRKEAPNVCPEIYTAVSKSAVYGRHGAGQDPFEPCHCKRRLK